MTNLQKTLVDLPIVSGVHVKTVGTRGEKYVYRCTKYFRNAYGKSSVLSNEFKALKKQFYLALKVTQS